MIHMRRYIILLLIISFSLSALPAQAAIQYGSSSQQAPFAASTTQHVSDLIGKVVDGTGVFNSSWTSNQSGFWKNIWEAITAINDWLDQKAGIDFFGIVKAIGHLFATLIYFIVDLIKWLL